MTMRSMLDRDDLVGTTDAAALLGVHPQTLRGYEKDGRIQARRLPGGYRRWRVGDVLDLRDASRGAAAVTFTASNGLEVTVDDVDGRVTIEGPDDTEGQLTGAALVAVAEYLARVTL